MITALTACSNPAEPPVLSDEPPQLVPAMALPDNAVDNAVSKLDGIAEELMKSSGIPGMAVAVVHGGKTIYAKGFGVRDSRNPAKGDSDTVFQLASLSKPIAASVVAGVGPVGWDTPVAGKLPWFALSDPAVTRMLTVGDLFAHRSGLPDHAGDMLEDLGYDRRTVLERLRLLPLAPFRTSYAYTNFGVTAGAEAVAAAAGKSWEDLSEAVIYRPLDMASTSSRFSDYAARTNKAVGHVLVDGAYQPRYTRDPDPQSPAGGVSSSVNDMAHWLSMVLANGTYNGAPVADPQKLLAAVTPRMVSSPPTEPAMRSGFYGYGFNVSTSPAGRVQFSHSGAFSLGAGTNFVVIPSADVAIIALTNATPVGVAETLTAEFTDLVEFGKVREDWRGLYAEAFAGLDKPVGDLAGRQPPSNPAPSRPLPSYVGNYANDYWGPAKVANTDGKLTLTLGPRRDFYPLKHWDADVFTFALRNENAPPGSVSKATFDGNTLTLEYFDTDKMGTFSR
ncbi:MAG: serine hydrolase [Mycobacterium sp.]|nr:serine hydrolase [Mycobacterium sp.]